MTVLVDHEIEELVGTDDLIKHFELSSLESASYDMRLGERYVRAGEVKLLSDQAPTLVLQPGEFALLCTLEHINMPLNLIGHNGIMSPWAKRGLVSLFSPQIDPGFSGILIVPVFNAGDAPISITKHEKVVGRCHHTPDVPGGLGQRRDGSDCDRDRYCSSAG